jgi:hypothetical protein
LVDYWNMTTGVSRETYYSPDVIIRPAPPSAFNRWWDKFKYAARNDFEGEAGYEVLGKHIVPILTNSLGMVIGIGELNMAWKAGNAFRLTLAITDVSLAADDLLGAGSSATPLERILPNDGKAALNTIKLGFGLNSLGEGGVGVYKGMRRDANELGINIFKGTKAAFDTDQSIDKVKHNTGKFGMQDLNLNDEKEKK